jgi:CO/xanthine dehydrogenase Mo-binding subunit
MRRKDGREKASGYAIYTPDLQFAGMLHLRIPVRSHPHARIREMRTTRIQALPGVRAALSFDGSELTVKANTSGHSGQADEGHEPVLNRVGYWRGMPMGVGVAADTEDIVNEAVGLAEIEWEDRLFNLDQEEVLKPGASLSNPESHPGGNKVSLPAIAPLLILLTDYLRKHEELRK